MKVILRKTKNIWTRVLVTEQIYETVSMAKALLLLLSLSVIFELIVVSIYLLTQ